ncbi:MAG: alkane 1-monooxygenase [Halobacteriovoraceae bacterium]|nr:alkane 1-monooxygenase [Halobacteriovoraceae bacterium]
MPQLSLLDLVFVNDNQNEADALKSSVQVAQTAERLGYSRIWVAEHHNMPAIASAATSVVIGHLAAHTERIRIGAGGIMLPNHSPLSIAEQFGTLESLFPNRIDLGLGRAPGTDQRTMRALRTDIRSSERFPDDVLELQKLLSNKGANEPIVATPGFGTQVPLWILGSSTFGAQLAAHFGLPYAFASHFAPDAIDQAIDHYRNKFSPSEQQDKPYFMLGVNIIIADTDEEAQYLASSQRQSFVNLRRGHKLKFQPPIEDMNTFWNEPEKIMAEHMLKFSFVGSKQTVQTQLRSFINKYQPNELMVVTSIYDLEKKMRSLELLSEINLSL